MLDDDSQACDNDLDNSCLRPLFKGVHFIKWCPLVTILIWSRCSDLFFKLNQAHPPTPSWLASTPQLVSLWIEPIMLQLIKPCVIYTHLMPPKKYIQSNRGVNMRVLNRAQTCLIQKSNAFSYRSCMKRNKLAGFEATLVRNSAHPMTDRGEV